DSVKQAVRLPEVVAVPEDVCGDGFECGAGVHAGCGFDRVVVCHVVPGVGRELVTENGGGVDRGCGLVDDVVGDHASPTSRPSTASTALIRESLTLTCSSASSSPPRSSFTSWARSRMRASAPLALCW